MEIYRVGGYVRDKLLGLRQDDCDYVVVGSSPQEMLSQGFTPVGNYFPVFLHPHTKEEYALARTERKHGRGHRGFIVDSSPDVTLEEDLSRRDLTINAIAEDKDGKLIDPFGGINDLKNKILRHVSAAFSEDPLRILRVARFRAKFNFAIAPSTLDILITMAKNKDGLSLSKERIYSELEKALITSHPSLFFKTLLESQNLEIFFPSLAKILVNDDILKLFSADLDNFQTKSARFAILAIYLVNTSFNFAEFTNSNKTINYIKCIQLILNCLNNEASNEDILTLIKKTNAIRNPVNFQASAGILKEWLYKKADPIRLGRLELVFCCMQNLQKPLLKEIIPAGSSNQEIAQKIYLWQLDQIHQVRLLMNMLR